MAEQIISQVAERADAAMNCPECNSRMLQYQPGWAVCLSCAVLAEIREEAA